MGFVCIDSDLRILMELCFLFCAGELQRPKRWDFYALRTDARNKEDTCVLRIFNQDKFSSCRILFFLLLLWGTDSQKITMIGEKSTILEWVVGECWITNL